MGNYTEKALSSLNIELHIQVAGCHDFAAYSVDGFAAIMRKRGASFHGGPWPKSGHWTEMICDYSTDNSSTDIIVQVYVVY